MFRVDVKIVHFNIAGYSKALQEAVDEQVREAAREWLRAVILKVPVYTGMARGSLLPLGRYLDINIPISPIATRKYGDPGKGELLGFFDFHSSAGDRISTFTFNTEVEHFLINEYGSGLGSPPLTNPTPWHSFITGKEAFQKHLKAHLKTNVPRIKNYITTVKSG